MKKKNNVQSEFGRKVHLVQKFLFYFSIPNKRDSLKNGDRERIALIKIDFNHEKRSILILNGSF